MDVQRSLNNTRYESTRPFGSSSISEWQIDTFAPDLGIVSCAGHRKRGRFSDPDQPL
jgi:hypothetical protein